MTMAKNVLPFPTPDPDAGRSTAVQHDRVIFQIGARRLAFEFCTVVTEVNPVDAEILSIRTGPQRDPATGGFAGRAKSETNRHDNLKGAEFKRSKRGLDR